jgi:putative endonuclease
MPLITFCVLKGKTGKRYTGITNNFSRRLREHRSLKTKGNELLGDFLVVHTETFSDYKSARKREKFLKSGQGRKWLDKLENVLEPATKPAGKARL